MKPSYWEVYRAVRDTKEEFTSRQVQYALGNSPLRDLSCQILDSRYWAVPRNTWEMVLSYNGTDKNTYKKDVFDCDNFAILFSGTVAQKWSLNSAGIAMDFSGRHAYNIILVVENGKIEPATIEPQNDNFILRTSGMYKAKIGYIIFA